MNIFYLYFKLGISHILDIQGYDHILFVMALTVVYSIKEWKHVIILATAFTLGHTTTLALATLNLISFPANITEILIAFTIFITGFANLFKMKKEYSKKIQIYKYITAFFFGLVHGLGFSGYLRTLLGFEENIVPPLFAFNIGIEIAQIIVIICMLMLNFLIINVLNKKQREWNLIISGATMGIALMLIIDRI